MESDALKTHDCKTASAAIKEMYGCDAPLPKDAQREYFGISFDRCPHYYLRDDEWLKEVFSLYNWYKAGFLPFAGGWLDQPNVYVETIELIELCMQERTRNEVKRRPTKPVKKR